MKRTFQVLGVLTAILLSYALYQALIVAPSEQTMGDVHRIFLPPRSFGVDSPCSSSSIWWLRFFA